MPPRKKKLSPLRQALADKTTLRTYYEMAVKPLEEIEAAQRELEVARQMAAATLLQDNPAMRERIDEALERAQSRRDSCFHRIWFRSLGLTEFDALVQLHPPTEAQKKDKRLWNSDTFDYALLEEATEDSDLTAADWADELADEKKWPAPDRARLINMCMQAQRQTLADAAPKG